jgi:Fic family protein
MPRFETRTWLPDPDAYGPRSARRGFRYRALVPDPVGSLDPVVPGTLAGLLAEAEQQTAALNLNPPTIANLEALARRLLRAESVASSWIEGVRISQRRLARAEAEGGETRDATARAVLGNVAAMERVTTLADQRKPMELEDLLALHRALMEHTPDSRGAGALRERQNWIGGNPYSPLDASFIPPPPEYVPGLVDDLFRFLAREDLPASIQAGVAHAQFEAIHFFADGNGRVGRTLIHFVLRRRGLAPRFVPPVSLVLAASSNTYIRGLNAFAQGQHREWLEVFGHALRSAVERSASLAQGIAALQKAWRERAGRPRKDSSAEALIGALPAWPVLTADSAAKLLGRSIQAANEALAALERAGVVKVAGAVRRNRTFESPELLELVAAFEKELALAELEPGRQRARQRGPER